VVLNCLGCVKRGENNMSALNFTTGANNNYTMAKFMSSADTDHNGSISASEQEAQIQATDNKIRKGTAKEDDLAAEVIATNLAKLDKNKYADPVTGDIVLDKLLADPAVFAKLNTVNPELARHFTQDFRMDGANTIKVGDNDTFNLTA
jgi:hypothetical protein